MEHNSIPAPSGDNDSPKKSSALDGAQDGRNKEWEDRARVNLEEVSDDTRTNVERDFETENPDTDTKGKTQDNNEVY